MLKHPFLAAIIEPSFAVSAELVIPYLKRTLRGLATGDDNRMYIPKFGRAHPFVPAPRHVVAIM